MSLLPRWAEYGLVILMAWFVSGLLVSNPKSINQQLPVLQEKTKVTSNMDTLFQEVSLFGQAQVEEQKVKQTVAVVASKLNIKLVGTVVAGKKSAAMVTVAGSKKQQVFFLDEEVQPGVLLKQVEAATIVVDNRGKMERIALEAGKQLVNAPANPVQVPRFQQRAKLPLTNRRLNKQKLQKQMRNFSTLLSQARVTPHFTNKKPDGFMISNIVKGSLYEEIGLLNGDVIKKVNGESVTGAEQAMRMYRELQNATFIDVEIERSGSLQQLSYTIQ
jgi:general secretion pathway protein C